MTFAPIFSKFTHFAASPFQTAATSLGCDFGGETVMENDLLTTLGQRRNSRLARSPALQRGFVAGRGFSSLPAAFLLPAAGD